LKKNKISKNWIKKQHRDIFVRRSKIEGFRSRAVYKISEIDKKFKILKNKKTLIDLGAAPGSWTQYAAKNIKNGKILSIDLNDMEPIQGATLIKGDFTEIEYQKQIKNFFNSKIDVVISDMAANTTGNKNLDAIWTGNLCKEAILFAKEILNKNGHFVSKIFMGSIFNEILSESKSVFKEVRIFKPESSRKISKENYIICKFLR